MSDLHDMFENVRAQEEGRRPILEGILDTENGQQIPFQLFYTKYGPGITYEEVVNRVKLMPDQKGDYHLHSRESPFEIRKAREQLWKIATFYSQPSKIQEHVVPAEQEKAPAEFGYLAALLFPDIDESKH